jgi:hypothetical protein
MDNRTSIPARYPAAPLQSSAHTLLEHPLRALRQGSAAVIVETRFRIRFARVIGIHENPYLLEPARMPQRLPESLLRDESVSTLCPTGELFLESSW